MKRTIRELIRQKSITKIPQVYDEVPVQKALQTLEDHNAGILLVMRKNRLIGVFSERDFVRGLQQHSVEILLSLPVCRCAKKQVYYVTPDFTLEECMQVMTTRKVRHLPVLEDQRPIAVISMRNIMEAMVDDKEFMIDELTKYITGMAQVSPTASRRVAREPKVLTPEPPLAASH